MQVPAIRYKQNGRRLYSFVVNGKDVGEVASVPHVGRDTNGSLSGFQRPEIRNHIKNIADYLTSGTRAILPNCLVMAFHRGVTFTAAYDGADVGTLDIPADAAWLVDGQQRAAALRDAELEDFPVNVVAFLSESEEFTRETFARVNSGRPLDRKFVMELVPSISGALTGALEKKRTAIEVCMRLNNDPDSPLRGAIDTATNPKGPIPSGGLIGAIEKSAKSGYLNVFVGDDSDDIDGMLSVLKTYWTAVVAVFGEAWALADKKGTISRIKQGPAVAALMALMDAIAQGVRPSKLTVGFFRKGLNLIRDNCRWTKDSGEWAPGVAWDSFSASAGASRATAHLLNLYNRAKMSGSEDEGAESVAA